MDVEIVEPKAAASNSGERTGAHRLGRMGKAKRATEPHDRETKPLPTSSYVTFSAPARSSTVSSTTALRARAC